MTVDERIAEIKDDIKSIQDETKKAVLYDCLEELLQYKADLREKQLTQFDYDQTLIERLYEV